MTDARNKKIAFIDRDGVINKKAPEHCYITKKEDFIFNKGIFDVMEALQKSGYEFIVITNQRGVARGLYTEEDLKSIHDVMIEGFSKHSMHILDVLYCPHEHNSCECRKPKDGMLKESCRRFDIDIKNSILISDSREDVSMGEEFGIGTNIFVTSDNPLEVLTYIA